MDSFAFSVLASRARARARARTLAVRPSLRLSAPRHARFVYCHEAYAPRASPTAREPSRHGGAARPAACRRRGSDLGSDCALLPGAGEPRGRAWPHRLAARRLRRWWRAEERFSGGSRGSDAAAGRAVAARCQGDDARQLRLQLVYEWCYAFARCLREWRMQLHEAFGGADTVVYCRRHGLSDPGCSRFRYHVCFVDSSGSALVLGHSVSICKLFHARCRNDIHIIDPDLLPDTGLPEYQTWI